MPSRSRTSALRTGRWSAKGFYYLVTAATADRQSFFKRRENAQAMLDCFAWLQAQGRICRLAVVVMPDHVHAVVELKGATLPSLMHSLKSFTAKRVNGIEGRRGRVWQRQYHETALRDEPALLEAIRYCLLNPVRKGLVRTPGEYPFLFCVYPVDSI